MDPSFIYDERDRIDVLLDRREPPRLMGPKPRPGGKPKPKPWTPNPGRPRPRPRSLNPAGCCGAIC